MTFFNGIFSFAFCLLMLLISGHNDAAHGRQPRPLVLHFGQLGTVCSAKLLSLQLQLLRPYAARIAVKLLGKAKMPDRTAQRES